MAYCLAIAAASRLTLKFLKRLQFFQSQAFALVQRLSHDVVGLVPKLLDNLMELQHRCVQLAKQAVRGKHDLVASLSDASAYVLDAAITLLAFVEVYPPAAGLLLQAQQGDLLTLLASLYSQLLPAVRSALQAARASSAAASSSNTGGAGDSSETQGLAGITEDASKQVDRCDSCLVQLAFELLCCAFLSPEGRADSHGSSSSG